MIIQGMPVVELGFGEDGPVICEGCGTELPPFLDGCPYCDGDDEGDDTLPCPACGAEISDLSEQCAVCGAWITPRVPGRRPARVGVWVVVAAIVLLLLALAF